MRVKRSAGSRARGGGKWLKGLLTSPITPVLVGLAIVLGAGYWVMKGDQPASGEKAEQTEKGTSPSGGQSPQGEAAGPGAPGTGSGGTDSGGASGAETGGPGNGGAGSGMNGAAGGGTETSGPAASSPVADPAILAARAQIDRSGGAAKTMLITAYYADGLTNGLSLQPVEIKVPLSVSRIKVTAEQLLNAPQDLKLYSGVPAGTKVLSVNLKEGVAIVDLSPEVTSVRGAASVNNIMASLVYSLTAIPEVKAVQLWVNGRPAMLDGVEWERPLSRADLDARNLFKVEPVIKYSGS